MNNTDTGTTHPITTHVRDAAEHIRLANHATYSDQRNVAQLYDTLGALTDLLRRLPQLIEHLRAILGESDAQRYEHDTGGSSEESLNLADFSLIDVLGALSTGTNALSQAWSDLGHLRFRDTETHSK